VTNGESGSPSLADVEAVVRENVSGYVDSERHEQGKQRLLASLRRGPSATGWRARRFVALAAALGALTGVGIYVWKQREGVRLTYDVSGGLLSESGYVRSSGPGGARLSFSDGTRVDLQDGARARIAAVDAHGARFAIENGHIAFSVSHAPRAAWYVDAGPFVVQVTGTQFEVDWSSYDDTLSIDLHEGSLVVTGPPAPTGVLLRAGQRLTAHEGRLSIEAMEAAFPPTDQPSPFEPPLPELDPFLNEPLPSDSAAVPLAAPSASAKVARPSGSR
jgi:ferric-dicitrate binding protein FerR (iron transport regulator)